MNAKIMLLTSDDRGDMLCSYAEECLLGIGGAFGHSFSLLREKLGEKSIQAYGTSLTRETVDACRKCSGIVLGNASAEGVELLAAELRLPLQVRCEPGFTGLVERDPLICRAVSLEPEMLEKAAENAFDLAQAEGRCLLHALPSGKNAENWEKTVNQKGKDHPEVECVQMAADRALSFLLEQPEKVGTLFCPPYIGKMYLAAFTSRNLQPALLYDCYKGDRQGMYAAVQRENTRAAEEASPLGILLAACALLRDTLHLEREAECLYSAVRNVYESGWRTKDMNGEKETVPGSKIVELILNQIELASRFV